MADDDVRQFDDDFNDEELLAAWEEVDRQAAAELRISCAEALAEGVAQPDLEAAARKLRDGVVTKDARFEYVRTACGWSGVPDETDEELWLTAVASTISPPEDPGTDPEDQSVVMALEHADWFGVVTGLVQRGPRAAFDVDSVADDIDELTAGDDLDPDGARAVLERAVQLLAPLWRVLGVLDEQERVTRLGWWGLPHALLRVWGSADEGPDTSRSMDLYADLDQQGQDALVRLLAERPRTVEELRRELVKESVFIDVVRLERVLTWPVLGHRFHDGTFAHVPSLAEGSVLTHRLTAKEAELGVLGGGVDLALVEGLAEEPLSLGGGGIVRVRYAIADEPLPDDSGSGLVGPDAWLDGLEVGDLLALRYIDGELSLERLESEPEATPETVTAFVRAARAAAERAAADPEDELPAVPAVDIILDLLRERPQALRQPVPPLSELLAETDLEVDRGFVGLPGTAWEGEPDWLSDSEQATYRSWRKVSRAFRHDGTLPPDEELATLAVGLLSSLVLDLVAVDATADPKLDQLFERIAAVASDAAAPGPLYLRARAAEGRGDLTGWLTWLEAVLEIAPNHDDAAADLADLRALAGDAHEANRLYQSVGLGGRPEVQALRPFLSAPEGEVGRNKPCPCGSGKKYKMCHGKTAPHPLSSRSTWLWAKIQSFVQRGKYRDSLLSWAQLFSREDLHHRRTVALAMGDSFVHDTAIVDGEILTELLDVVGALLPEDEMTLARRWVITPRRLMEVTRVMPMRGVEVKDRLTDTSLEIRDRKVSTQVETKDLLFGRPLDDGTGTLRFFTDPIPVPRMMRGPLLQLLRRDASTEEVITHLGGGGRPQQLQNTDGHELVQCKAGYELSHPDSAWGELCAGHDVDGDRILVHSAEAPTGGRTLRGTYSRRTPGKVVVETNSVERLRELQARLLQTDPDARLVDESTVSVLLGGGAGAAGRPDRPGGPSSGGAGADRRKPGAEVAE